MSTATADGSGLTSQIKQMSVSARNVTLVDANVEKGSFGLNLIARVSVHSYIAIQNPLPKVTNDPNASGP